MTRATTISGPSRRTIRRPREELIALVAGTVVLVVCSVIAADGVPGWEADLFHAINGLPGWLRGPAWVVQLAGMMGMPFVLAAVALIGRRWRLAVALVALTPLKLFFERWVVKRLVERQRPFVTVCDGDSSCGEFRGAPLHGLSYVSGHAVIIGGLVWLLLPHLGRRGRLVVVLVALAALTARVYIGAHNPLDVVGGAGLGVAIAAVLNYLVGVPAPGRRARPSRRR